MGGGGKRCREPNFGLQEETVSNTIVVEGKVWKFGEDINTDFMSPSFSKGMEWEEQKKTVLHIHKGFTEGVQPGDVIVAGANFGCGSSRQSAPQSLKRLFRPGIVIDHHTVGNFL